MTIFSSTPTSREGRERQAKREWHPTIPFGQTANKSSKMILPVRGWPLTVIYCHINIGLPRGGRENTYHVSTVALEGNQEISWPEPASFDPMHKLNPKVSMPCMATTDIQPREARGQRGGPGTMG